MEKETRSGNKRGDDCFWFHNIFVLLSCWATANILISHPADSKVDNQPLVSLSPLSSPFYHLKCENHLLVYVHMC